MIDLLFNLLLIDRFRLIQLTMTRNGKEAACHHICRSWNQHKKTWRSNRVSALLLVSYQNWFNPTRHVVSIISTIFRPLKLTLSRIKLRIKKTRANKRKEMTLFFGVSSNRTNRPLELGRVIKKRTAGSTYEEWNKPARM